MLMARWVSEISSITTIHWSAEATNDENKTISSLTDIMPNLSTLCSSLHAIHSIQPSTDFHPPPLRNQQPESRRLRIPIRSAPRTSPGWYRGHQAAD